VITTVAPTDYDVVVVGSGIAGLSAALTAAPSARVVVVTKGAERVAEDVGRGADLGGTAHGACGDGRSFAISGSLLREEAGGVKMGKGGGESLGVQENIRSVSFAYRGLVPR